MIAFGMVGAYLWVGIHGRAFCTGQTTLGL